MLSTSACTLLLGAASLALAGPEQQKTAPVSAEAPCGFTFCEGLPRLFKPFDAARDNADNPWVQEVSIKLRAQYQWGSIDPNGGGDRVKGGADGHGRRYNDEWRRVRLGAQAKVLRHFTLCTVWNIGGLDARDQYRNGRWSDGVSSGTVEELYLSGTFKPVTFTLGKHKPSFIGEYRLSSAKIVTMERSSLVNQLSPAKLYGLSFKNADKKAPLGWELGAWVNGEHEGAWVEPALNSGDNIMLGASLSHAVGEKGRLYLDYMHSCVNTGRPQADSEYAGPGARDILALTWETKKDRLNFMAEAIAGFNVIGGDEGAENVYGLIFIPSYRVTPHVEGVFRYQLAAGSNAVGHDSRYVTTNGAFAKTSDLLHGIYIGVNYYVCPENTDTMRIMAGAEYVNSHGRASNGEKGFSGWNYSMGVRCNF